MARKLRSSAYIPLVDGNETKQLQGARLPTVKEVLCAFYYQLRTKKLPLRDSARNTIQQVFEFWDKTTVPTIGEGYAMKKILALHSQWRGVIRNHVKVKYSKPQRVKEQKFRLTLPKLFDIATPTALEDMRNTAADHPDADVKKAITEDIEFLLGQREKERRGSIIGKDITLANKKKLREEKKKRIQKNRAELEERRKREAEKRSQGTIHF